MNIHNVMIIVYLYLCIHLNHHIYYLFRRTQYWEALKQFRSEFRYSNTMPTVAGVVAGLLSEEGNYEEAMLNNLFQPLEMYNTTFTHLLSEEQLENLATPYMTGVV